MNKETDNRLNTSGINDTLTVGDLKRILANLPDDLLVVIDDDSWWYDISAAEEQIFDYDDEQTPVLALVANESYSKSTE